MELGLGQKNRGLSDFFPKNSLLPLNSKLILVSYSYPFHIFGKSYEKHPTNPLAKHNLNMSMNGRV